MNQFIKHTYLSKFTKKFPYLQAKKRIAEKLSFSICKEYVLFFILLYDQRSVMSAESKCI